MNRKIEGAPQITSHDPEHLGSCRDPEERHTHHESQEREVIRQNLGGFLSYKRSSVVDSGPERRFGDIARKVPRFATRWIESWKLGCSFD